MSEETGDTRSTRQARRPNYLSGFRCFSPSVASRSHTPSEGAARASKWRLRTGTPRPLRLVSNVDNVQVALAKSLATGSPRLRVGALSDVWKQAGDAQANLNSLPVTQELLRTSAFLTQVGDFAFVTARKTANQQEMTEEDWTRLATMKQQARELSEGLSKMLTSAVTGDIRWLQVARQADARTASGKAGGNVVTDGLTRVDEQVQHFPTLIYDGPFSDHVEDREPAGISGPDVSPAEAVEVAKRFVPFDASGYSTTVEDEIRGKIPAYRVRLEAPKNSGRPDAVVDVSRKGGKVVLMNIARDIGQEKLDLEQAVARAREFLSESGFGEMQPTFASQVGGVATIPFVGVQQGALVYPDMIKVKVALDSGDILSFDALSYLMSHRERTIPKAKISAAEARELLSPALEVQAEPRLAVIPIETVDTPEAVCWEFRGTSFGDEFYVYINVENGREESILQLIPTSEGTLTL